MYAQVSDVQARMLRTLSEDEQKICAALLADVAIIIDRFAPCARPDDKKVVSCRCVQRALGDGENGYPLGASQGSMSGLGYSQSWTMGSGGSVGELYLSKQDRQLLGIGNRAGSYSPVEALI